LPARFDDGEGLLGEVLRSGKPLLVEPVPDGYLKVRSALGVAAPRALSLVPLTHDGKVKGVLELALLGPWSPQAAELLSLSAEALTIALEVALARAQTKALLQETRAQADRLQAQEERLRSTNEELQAQQEELRQSNFELGHTADELEAQRKQLEERNHELELARANLERQARELATVSSYKSQFLTNMSHELRTPLNSMLLLSSLLAENEGKNLTEKQVEYCRTINASGRDLLALINQVLDLAKIEAGKQEVHAEPVKVADLVQRARRVFEPLARDKGLEFGIQVHHDVPQSLLTDRQRVDQIVTNLLGNAIKFTSAGSVRLEIRREDRRVAFLVSDTGAGIAPQDRDRLFVPFEQLTGQGDRRFGGTGLGLSIARELAGLLGGALELLRSDKGRGSTFALYLPIEPPKTTEAPSTETAVPQKAAEGLKAGSPSLLLIEDDRIFAETFGEIITAQGFGFLHATDGASGLALARTHLPTGILLDVKLPDIDGFKVMERLRADPKTAHIPVHIVSAMQEKERGRRAGAVGYLTKPAAKSELRDAVQSLVSEATQGRMLVVEDDALTGDSVMDALASEHIAAHRVTSAAAAVAALEAEPFAGLILDLSLPDMDGLDLLELVQKRIGDRMPPVVVYTGRALSRVEIKRLQAYTDAIVLKQGDSAERIISEVRLFLRRLEEGLGARRPRHQGVASSLRLEGRRLLVVDDDMRTVYALSAMLRARGADVVAVDNGKAALDALSDGKHFDAVLMDIMMPEMDGYEATRRIRAQPRTRELPVIALTAKAMKDDEKKCLAAGATAYIAKPIDAERLFPVLQRVLGPPA
jgi:CheY-like chemotaxis protein